MKIAFLMVGDLDRLSGGYLYNKKLVEYFIFSGHEVDIVKIPKLPRLIDIVCNLWFLMILIRKPYDLVLEDEMIYPSVFLLNFWLTRRSKVICLVHMIDWVEHNNQIKRIFLKIIEGLTLRKCHLIIVNSNYSAALASKLGVTNEQIRMIYPGHNRFTKMLCKDNENIVKLLYVGQYVERKGLRDLINALGKLPNSGWLLDAVGDDKVDIEYSNSLYETSDALRISQRVRFHGKVSPKDLNQFYECADVFILPTKYEAFGMVVVEAMAHSLPIIAYSVGGVIEQVSDGVNGLLIQKDDINELSKSIKSLIENKDLRRNLGRNGRELSRQFPLWDDTCYTVLQELILLYQS